MYTTSSIQQVNAFQREINRTYFPERSTPCTMYPKSTFCQVPTALHIYCFPRARSHEMSMLPYYQISPQFPALTLKAHGLRIILIYSLFVSYRRILYVETVFSLLPSGASEKACSLSRNQLRNVLLGSMYILPMIIDRWEAGHTEHL